MSKGVKVLVIIISVIIISVAAYMLINKKGSIEAIAVKSTFPANSPEKFLEYLRRVLTPEQLESFKGWIVMIESGPDIEGYLKNAVDEASSFGFPKEVGFYRAMLWNMHINNEVSKELWQKLHVDSVFIYRKGILNTGV